MSELPLVEIFTDGACRGNPGPGGWAVLIRAGVREKEVSGGEPLTTNNRMELLAAIRGLEALKKPCRVQLHTDSIYVRDGITKWIHNWQRNGWRTSDKKPVKNAELWQALVDGADGSFYFKGEGDSSVWLSPHDEIESDPCDAAPEEIADHSPERMTFKLPRELVA